MRKGKCQSCISTIAIFSTAYFMTIKCSLARPDCDPLADELNICPPLEEENLSKSTSSSEQKQAHEPSDLKDEDFDFDLQPLLKALNWHDCVDRGEKYQCCKAPNQPSDTAKNNSCVEISPSEMPAINIKVVKRDITSSIINGFKRKINVPIDKLLSGLRGTNLNAFSDIRAYLINPSTIVRSINETLNVLDKNGRVKPIAELFSRLTPELYTTTLRNLNRLSDNKMAGRLQNINNINLDSTNRIIPSSATTVRTIFETFYLNSSELLSFPSSILSASSDLVQPSIVSIIDEQIQAYVDFINSGLTWMTIQNTIKNQYGLENLAFTVPFCYGRLIMFIGDVCTSYKIQFDIPQTLIPGLYLKQSIQQSVVIGLPSSITKFLPYIGNYLSESYSIDVASLTLDARGFQYKYQDGSCFNISLAFFGYDTNPAIFFTIDCHEWLYDPLKHRHEQSCLTLKLHLPGFPRKKDFETKGCIGPVNDVHLIDGAIRLLVRFIEKTRHVLAKFIPAEKLKHNVQYNGTIDNATLSQSPIHYALMRFQQQFNVTYLPRQHVQNMRYIENLLSTTCQKLEKMFGPNMDSNTTQACKIRNITTVIKNAIPLTRARGILSKITQKNTFSDVINLKNSLKSAVKATLNLFEDTVCEIKGSAKNIVRRAFKKNRLISKCRSLLKAVQDDINLANRSGEPENLQDINLYRVELSKKLNGKTLYSVSKNV